MKSRLNYPLRVFANSLVVLILISLMLFWLRFFCRGILFDMMPGGSVQGIGISRAGLVPDEFESDPNIIGSHVRARIREDNVILSSLGIVDYVYARLPGGRRCDVYFFDHDKDWMYFDRELGQIVLRYQDMRRAPDTSVIPLEVQLYIGPEGISRTSGKELGRFVKPVIDFSGIYGHGGSFRGLILFDKKLRRFFKVDFDKQTIVKGPQLQKGDSYEPVQMGRFVKASMPTSYLNWVPPMVQNPEEKRVGPSSYNLVIPVGVPDAGPFALVLDKSGRLDLLDKETLEIVRPAGWLPAPRIFFDSIQSSTRPKDLLGYGVYPLSLTKSFFEDRETPLLTFGRPYLSQLHQVDIKPPIRVESEYLGMFVMSHSRDGTGMVVAVYDKDGKQVKVEHTKGIQERRRNTKYIPSCEAFFFSEPWAPALTIGKFLLENLHPPVLSIASYLTASTFEAASGHKALFLLPDSFVAMRARAGDEYINAVEKVMLALWLMLPSITLSAFLAWRVQKDTVVVGFSKNTRLFWVVGTLAFGLSAYITYRLTKPDITLVTCANCGRPRRPDMERCHRCRSGWHVPELVPPSWRVLDGAEQARENPAGDVDEGLEEDTEILG